MGQAEGRGGGATGVVIWALIHSFIRHCMVLMQVMNPGVLRETTASEVIFRGYMVLRCLFRSLGAEAHSGYSATIVLLRVF